MIPLKPGALITSSLKMMECDRQTDHVDTQTTWTSTRLAASSARSDATRSRTALGAAASRKSAAPATRGTTTLARPIVSVGCS